MTVRSAAVAVVAVRGTVSPEAMTAMPLVRATRAGRRATTAPLLRAAPTRVESDDAGVPGHPRAAEPCHGALRSQFLQDFAVS